MTSPTTKPVDAASPAIGEDHAHEEAGHVHGPGCSHGHHHHHGPGHTFVRPEPKLGRNDPCSCGSGHKFKKCCGKAE